MRRTLSLSAAGVAAAASLTLAAPAEAAPAQTAAPVSAQAQDSIQVTGWSKWKTGKLKKPTKGVAASWKYHTRWVTRKGGGRWKEFEIRLVVKDSHLSDKRHPRVWMEQTSWDARVESSKNFSAPHEKSKTFWWKGTPRTVKFKGCVDGNPFQKPRCDKKWTKIYSWNNKE